MSDFIAQRDARWLLVSASAADAPIGFKILRDCERNSRREVFLLFGTPFVNAEQYVEEVVGQFVAEYRALDAARVAQHHAPLGSLPGSISAPRGPGDNTPPARRLEAVIDAAWALLPDDGRYRLVWAFWPMEVADPAAYGQLLQSLIPLNRDSQRAGTCDVRPEWIPSVRLIAREAREHSQPSLPEWAGPYVVRTQIDFSAAALTRQATVEDPQQPEAGRMRALFMQAAIELAHGQVAAASTKYVQLLAYYQKHGNLNMQTVVLLQLGEAYQRQLRWSAARACYEQALAPATAEPVPVCAALLAKNLGEVAFVQGRYSDALIGYQTWHRIASQLGDREGVAAALAKLALCQERLRQAALRTPRVHQVEAFR